jgi:hypothetical protein
LILALQLKRLPLITATGTLFRVTNREFEMDSLCARDGETLVLNIPGKSGSNRDTIDKLVDIMVDS